MSQGHEDRQRGGRPMSGPRRLVLLRHAKAVGGTGDDAARVLSAAGRAEMVRIAAEIARAGLRPDLALVSPASRTRETWARTGLDVPVRFEPSIYDAEPETLLDLVATTPDEVGTLMVVGHNPGLEDLALRLAAPGSSAALGLGLTTAALAVFELPEGSWHEIAPGTARLDHFATPASLAG